MKLLIDMNLSPEWINFLAQVGVEAVHWSTVGSFDVSDTEIMAYAKRNDLVVLTHDLDFSAILAATKGDKPSVVQVRGEDVNPAVIGPVVVGALTQMEAQLDQGALLSIHPGRARLRLLPLPTT